MEAILRWVSRAFKTCLIIAGLIAIAAVAVQVGAGWIDDRRAKESEAINAPDIVIDRAQRLEYPDPLHVKLPDGRIFRLAHLVPPDPDAPEYAAAMEQVARPLSSGGNRMRGLRVVGTNPQGETLVEMWGFHTAVGMSGNRSWSERRAGRIPRWKSLTWQLVSSGLFSVDPHSTDEDLRRWQDAARRDRRGLWADPDILTTADDPRAAR